MPLSNAAILRVVVKMTMHSQLVENVWYVRTKNAAIPESEVITTIRDNIWRKINQNISGDVTCDAISIQEIFPVHQDPYEEAIGEDGQLEGEALPTEVAAVVALKTGLGGRRNRGRKYIAGLVPGDTSQSRIISTRFDALQSDLNEIKNFFLASNSFSNLEMGIVHRSLAGAPVPLTADSFVPVNNIILRQILGTMRTRIPGHGA